MAVNHTHCQHLAGNAVNGFVFTAIVGAIFGSIPVHPSTMETSAADNTSASAESDVTFSIVHQQMPIAPETQEAPDSLDGLSSDDDAGGMSDPSDMESIKSD